MNVTKMRVENAISKIHELLLWDYEILPDGPLQGTRLTLEATLEAAEEALIKFKESL